MPCNHCGDSHSAFNPCPESLTAAPAPKGAADNSVRHDPPEVLPWDRPLVEQLRALVPPGKEIRYRWEELALQAADTIAALCADAERYRFMRGEGAMWFTGAHQWRSTHRLDREVDDAIKSAIKSQREG